MATRPRNSLHEPRRIALFFEQASHERLNELAQAAGVTRSQMAQWLVDTVERDEIGLPVGWAEDHPSESEQVSLMSP